ncbi:MAG: hypothetical protein H0U57_09595 [Tatlockia sp.]|nr:hypothetical protein [Tatlockia sp.]
MNLVLKKLHVENSPFICLSLILPSLLIIFALWLPFGFSLTGLIEEWGILGAFTTNGLFFIADVHSPMPAHAFRPLTILPHALAYFMDPDSFIYWHLLLILSLLLKGIATSYLIWQATSSQRWAMLAGLLVLLYPADTMQLSFRGLHINLALSLFLTSSSLLIAAFISDKPKFIYFYGFMSAIVLSASLTMYETTLALILLPFLLIYVRIGRRASISLFFKKKAPIIIWLICLLIYFSYIIFTSAHIQESYQESLISKDPIKTLHYTYSSLFNPGLIRSLLGGWFDALRIFQKEIGFFGYLYLLGITLFIFAVSIHFLKNDKKIKWNNNSALILRLALVGLLLAISGYIPYLFSPAHVGISQRTYLFATVGSVFFWIAILMTIDQWISRIADLSAFLLVLIGFSFQLFQFHHYVQISETQRTLLRNIINNFDGNLENKTLILFDGTNQLMHTWMFPQGSLQNALTYFYGHRINSIEICQSPGNGWKSVENSLVRTGKCIEDEKEWIFRAPSPVNYSNGFSLPLVPDKRVLKEKAIVLRIQSDGLIFPKPILDSQNLNQTKRYQNILSNPAWAEHFKKLWASNSDEKYKWSFGKWWSLDLPISGSGWREANWTLGKFFHHAAAWKSGEDAALLFDLKPQKGNYFLKGKFEVILNESIYKSIELRLNQHIIPFHWLDNGEFAAEVPLNLILTGSNSLAIHSLTDPSYYGLSLSLEWFELAPA